MDRRGLRRLSLRVPRVAVAVAVLISRARPRRRLRRLRLPRASDVVDQAVEDLADVRRDGARGPRRLEARFRVTSLV